MISIANEPLDHLVSRLEERILPKMLEANVPGLSIALIQNSETVWKQGFGVINAETRQPVKPETVFEGCSLSKPVFAYAALKLCDSRRLALDKPLSHYLPVPYVPSDPRARRITMRQALAHTRVSLTGVLTAGIRKDGILKANHCKPILSPASASAIPVKDTCTFSMWSSM